jgi:hypothetical protein
VAVGGVAVRGGRVGAGRLAGAVAGAVEGVGLEYRVGAGGSLGAAPCTRGTAARAGERVG